VHGGDARGARGGDERGVQGGVRLVDGAPRRIGAAARLLQPGQPRVDGLRQPPAVHATLSGELRLFLLALRPHLPADRLAADHEALVCGLEQDGVGVLREHLRVAAETLTSAGGTGRTDDLGLDRPPGREEEGAAGAPGDERSVS
jgi:hypothetical protein